MCVLSFTTVPTAVFFPVLSPTARSVLFPPLLSCASRFLSVRPMPFLAVASTSRIMFDTYYLPGHSLVYFCNFVYSSFLFVCFGCNEQVEVEIMERMADEWQAIEAKNARHDTSHKLHREKPMFCMDRCVTGGLYQCTSMPGYFAIP